jgi:glycosyltransferase involved in cell wall biosynthesis
MCEGLAAAGNEVLLATTDAECDQQLATTISKRVPTEFFPIQLGRSFKYSRPFKQWLDQNVQRFDIVHIHAVFNHACIAAANACRLKGVPYVVRPLGTLGPWAMQQKSLRKKIFWRFAAGEMLKSAAAIHYTSEVEKQAVENSLHLNHGVVVPLGIDVAQDIRSREEVDSRFPSLRDHPYVLVLSRLLPTKGIHLLLDAFLSAIDDDRFRSWRLVLAGDGPTHYLDALNREIANHVGADFVLFTGWVEGALKDALLQNAALLSLPSYHESFGLCVMESLACGVPVLISSEVNLASEVTAAQAGWVSRIDRDSLRQSLLEAMSSDAERSARGEKGKVLARNYRWPVIADQLSSMYAGILKNGRTNL